MSTHNNASTPDLDNIGGWPKILDEEPERPYEIFSPEHDNPENEPHDINCEACRFGKPDNIYAAMNVFVRFHDLGLYPPKWVLDHLASKIKKHLVDPDPDLLASQLGVSARGSGSTNPHDEYVWWQERTNAIEDMMILMGGFEITLVDAARAIIEKENLEIDPKTLTNSFRDIFGDPNLFHRKNRDHGPFFSEEDRDAYLKTFPRRTLRFIKKRAPAKR